MVQYAVEGDGLPSEERLLRWATAAIGNRHGEAEMTLRIVDEPEMIRLNRTYRGKPGATNVLSFPFDPPSGVPSGGLLGDVVICAPVVLREALEQKKKPLVHWAHLTIHGVLHLLGYDHQKAAEAAVMESREREILSRFGFSDPYEEDR